MANLTPLVLLHSNDLHGDFSEESVDDQVIGGISRLSGYVNQTRKTEPNVLYCIAGDMLQGSLIDTEFKGISTMDLMNLLNPNVASLGNHETDYGLAHLLFLEKCVHFPIVSANFFIKQPRTRLFKPYVKLKCGGMKIMFIGIITEEVMAGIRTDNLYSPLVDVEEAAREVGSICNAFRTTDVDLTVLLTHIGFEEDKELAALLDPRWGVDLIIGGHTHTVLEQPVLVNDILIAQAGVGTDQIGRFDLLVDTDTNTVHSWEWELVPVTEERCPLNPAIDGLLAHYSSQTEEKYRQMLCNLPRELTHPSRYQETSLGSLIADIHKACFRVELSLVGSGSVRREQAGPIITLGDIVEVLPYHSGVYQYKVTGKQLKQILRHIFREEAFEGEHTEFFQFSQGFCTVWSRSKGEFEKLELEGAPVNDEQLYTLSIEAYHRNNCEGSLGLTFEELTANAAEVCLSTDEQDIIIEYLTANPTQEVPVGGRFTLAE